jgi:hypothetical protein
VFYNILLFVINSGCLLCPNNDTGLTAGVLYIKIVWNSMLLVFLMKLAFVRFYWGLLIHRRRRNMAGYVRIIFMWKVFLILRRKSQLSLRTPRSPVDLGLCEVRSFHKIMMAP